jgi:hypothetical protein
VSDFRLESYLQLVHALRRRGLEIYSVKDWIARNPSRGAVIRHDIDRRPRNAVEMARAESCLGIKTSYYFRVVGSANDPDAMKAVARLGHEVGYHYEDLALAGGDQQKALELFAKHLREIRESVPVDTVIMHGSPLSPHYNLDMWRHATPSDFRLLGDAFLQIDYSDVIYFTDIGRSWSRNAANLRDRPPRALTVQLDHGGTEALLRYLMRSDAGKFAFSVHPERWDAAWTGWMFQLGRDVLANSAKRMINLLRRPASR